ncbi:unnamed protein product [Arabidopsis halleri]
MILLECSRTYVHCFNRIFSMTRNKFTKPLGECAQLNYGTPRRRIKAKGDQTKELFNLQIRCSPVYQIRTFAHSLKNSDQTRMN